jgi:aryl-alcohol dehydrogenase-like predicted oxidoreductase
MTESGRVELAPGYTISRVINGCWQLTPDHGGGPPDEAQALSRLAELFEHGFTTYDCADIYTGVEALLGRFRASLPDPDAMQVHTKLVPDKASLHELTAQRVDQVIERSLRRLGVASLDLVQFHWWDSAVPGLELLVERLLRAQAAGKVRHIGATNFASAQVQRLVAAGVPLVSLQAQYSLLDRRPERHMAAVAQHTGVRLLAYGALAGGFLATGWLGQAPPTASHRSLTKYRLVIEEAGGWAAYQSLLQTLTEIAARHATTPDLVAARWVLDQPMVAAIILGTGRSSRAAANLGLATLQLDADDRQALQAALGQLVILPGDMYDLERNSPRHAGIIRTELQREPA